MSEQPAHIFYTQPPSPHCPNGAAYGLYCENCGAVRGIFTPCPVDDFVAQGEEFTAKHTGCKPKEVAP